MKYKTIRVGDVFPVVDITDMTVEEANECIGNSEQPSIIIVDRTPPYQYGDKPKFKVGDRVRIDNGRWCPIVDATPRIVTGIIQNTNPDGYSYIHYYVDGEWVFDEEELKLVE